MKYRLPLTLAALWVLTACEKESTPTEPQTPQEMYAKVRELLQPNVEHDASDFAQALEWLKRAAEAGLLQAQTDLGGIYLEGGKGVQADAKQAFHWFSKAAEQGSKEALYYLGLLLQRGGEIPQDEAKAQEYWLQAAEGGVAEAQFRLGLRMALAETTTQEGIRWLTRAVQAKVPKLAAQAACALGNIYATGKPGVPQNMAEAARWYEIAARGGDSAAQLVYAIMLLQGGVVPQDARQGMVYLKMAAGQDNPRAIALLVNLLRNGEQSPETEQEANAWAERLEKLRTPTPPPTSGE